MNTLSFPKSRLIEPERSACPKYSMESGCDHESRECLGWRDEPHQHLVVTGYRPLGPEVRQELRALWVTMFPEEDVPPDDDIDNVIAAYSDTVVAGPWRYFNAGEIKL